jgi:hypothetical protein
MLQGRSTSRAHWRLQNQTTASSTSSNGRQAQ